MKRGVRGGSRLRSALIASALLHGGAIAFFWVSASRGAVVPAHKVYAVNLVSPPPRELGETAPERVAPAATAEAEPQPEAAPPAPEPTPPAPQPTPPAPQPAQPTPPTAQQSAARPEPSTPPRPTTRPAPTPPRQTPPTRQTPPRETAANPPKPAEPKPAEAKPATPPPRPAPTESRPAARQPERAAQPSTPAAQPRQGEASTRPAPSTGAAPSPTSTGGENLAVRTQGAVCPSEAYCNNIAAMVKRYFRRPADSYSDRGDVCFRIARNGAVSEIEIQRLRGSFAFRLALMEAVEQAGGRNEFGPLPREFDSDWLPVCVGVTPQM